MQSNFKRAVKCGVSLAVFVCSSVRDFFWRLFGLKRQGTCVILYYHSVPGDQQQRFADQLDAILRHTKPVSLSGPLILNPGDRCAAITFDDGFQNFAEVAVPELEHRKMPSTMFIIADALGKSFGPDSRPEPVMSAEEIRSLPRDLVAIGSHTLTHPFLPSLPEKEAMLELAGSRMKLEGLLNRPVLLFSFPFGGFNEKLVEQCRTTGYARVFTTLPEFSSLDPGAFVLGRVRVDPDDWPLEFRLKLAGAYRWLPWAFGLKRQLLANRLVRSFFSRREATASSPRPPMIHESQV